AYSVYSLDNDRIAGGYLESRSYNEFYVRNEIYKQNGFVYPGRLTSYLDFSHDDGFLFEIPSLDYYSSSYNYNVSMFFRNLGMNSIFHFSEDSGITPVSASLLNVDGAVSYNDSNEYYTLFDLFEPVSSGEDYILYKNPYPGSLGYTYDIDTFSSSVSGDVFNNLNNLYHDFTGEDVFIKCRREDKEADPVDDIKYAWEITLNPESGKHLFMYISPQDYFDNEMQGCNDYLYFEGALVAFYTDAPDRYIVDLGYSDGSTLNFLFETDNIDNEIYFYSFDDQLFLNSVGRLQESGLFNIEYSEKGINATVRAEENCNLAIFLPYENGYTIKVDGISTNYDSYAGCVLSVPIEKGIHEIQISYFTPGLKTGMILSAFGILCFTLSLFAAENKRRKSVTKGDRTGVSESRVKWNI
ncbi:MAG: YfhO family protein, partial [Lachnospiraceae bacterium]|nr:YfhO family protein [Lachnospiraceae bacterium]